MRVDPIRQIETQIDMAYRELPLFAAPVGSAVMPVLLAYDSMFMVDQEARMRGAYTVGSLQAFRLLREGFIETVRWLQTERQLERIDTRAVSEEEIARACAPFEPAANYSIVSDFYRMYGRGMVSAELRNELTVRFDYLPGLSGVPHGLHSIGFGECEKLTHAETINGELIDTVRDHFDFVPHTYRNGRIYLAFPEKLSCELALRFYGTFYDTDDLFSPTDDLGGITLVDFMTVFSALRFWSECCLIKYMASTIEGMPQEQCMPTQVVPHSFLVRKLASVTGLCRDLVATAVSLLSMSQSDGRADVIITPLINRAELVAWSCYALCSSRQPRNVLRALARSPISKSRADNLIGKREARMLELLTSHFDRFGWICDLNIRADGLGEVDFVAVHRECLSAALFIEIKMTLHPDELNETFAVEEALSHGQRQASKFASTFLGLSDDAKARLSRKIDLAAIKIVRCIVITPSAETTGNFNHGDVPCHAWFTLARELAPESYSSVDSFYSACKAMAWRERLQLGEHSHVAYSVGKFRFDIPCYALPPD